MSKNNEARRTIVESKNTKISNINENKDGDSLEKYKITPRKIPIR
jgi:hypothetical protein|tara:strand:+ start:148 stop:282 length:135 start_codon:yes stop_codon:yes gene_type:complete